MSKCKSCGEKPQKSRAFPSAVVEINNPEQLVLLRKVVIPASMPEETNPPVIGRYKNVILQYEDTNHLYIYSSDGIPTPIEANIPQEILDKIDQLEIDVDLLETGLADETAAREAADAAIEQEIEDLRNEPDVVDIVGTYAELLAYDTSDLGDKDVIRVLVDETHDDESTYYRWDKTSQTWTYIGAIDGYYTKDQTDALLDEKQDTLTAGDNITINNNVISAENGAKRLTTADYNYPADNPREIALWLLDAGTYTIENGASAEYASGWTYAGGGRAFQIFKNEDGIYTQILAFNTPPQNSVVATVSKTDGVFIHAMYLDVENRIVPSSTWGSIRTPLSAYQGKVLADRIGDLGTLATTAKTSTVAAINELDSALDGKQNTLTAGQGISIADESGDLVISATSTGPNVVQTTGTSTTDVMSQNATSSMVFADPSSKTQVQIGNGANAGASSGNASVAIGNRAKAYQNGGDGSSSIYPTAVGPEAVAKGNRSLALGANSSATYTGSVAVGAGANATSVGQFDIGTQYDSYGYNSSNYRLLTGVYDPQSAHDAATKGYVDSAVATIDTALDAKQDELTPGTGISITEESGALVISATGASIATINAQDWSALWQ